MITEDQTAVVEFLATPSTHGAAAAVERVDTHSSIAFLAGRTRPSPFSPVSERTNSNGRPIRLSGLLFLAVACPERTFGSPQASRR